jgi:hypothetical protein
MSFFNPSSVILLLVPLVVVVLHETWPFLLLPAIGPNPATFASISNAHFLRSFPSESRHLIRGLSTNPYPLVYGMLSSCKGLAPSL